MTIEQLELALKSTNLPVAYSSFSQKQMEKIQPPYIAYTVPSTEPITANSKIIFEINRFRVELYSLKLERTAENILEKVLADNKIAYSGKSRVVIESINLHLTAYEFELEEKV